MAIPLEPFPLYDVYNVQWLFLYDLYYDVWIHEHQGVIDSFENGAFSNSGRIIATVLVNFKYITPNKEHFGHTLTKSKRKKRTVEAAEHLATQTTR